MCRSGLRVFFEVGRVRRGGESFGGIGMLFGIFGWIWFGMRNGRGRRRSRGGRLVLRGERLGMFGGSGFRYLIFATRINVNTHCESEKWERIPFHHHEPPVPSPSPPSPPSLYQQTNVYPSPISQPTTPSLSTLFLALVLRFGKLRAVFRGWRGRWRK